MRGWKQNPELSMTLYYIITQPKANKCGKRRVEEEKNKIKSSGKQPVMVNSALEFSLLREENPPLQPYKS